MEKNVLENIEKIKKEKKLTKEQEKQIKSRLISNFAICIAILILIMTYGVATNFVDKVTTLVIFNIASVIFLIFDIAIFEVAYKKDSGTIATCGIEVLFVSIFTLFCPYIFLKFNYLVLCYVVIGIVAFYYFIKMILIYKKEKKNYLYKASDISEIIKKENKDRKAVKELEEILENELKAKNKKKTEEVRNDVKEEIKEASKPKQRKTTSTKKSNNDTKVAKSTSKAKTTTSKSRTTSTKKAVASTKVSKKSEAEKVSKTSKKNNTAKIKTKATRKPRTTASKTSTENKAKKRTTKASKTSSVKGE